MDHSSKKDQYILGISCFYHDSAACLIKNNQVFAAAQEERFTRKKHDSGFPHNAVAFCLKEAGISLDEVSHIGFYEKPFIKFERLLETYLAAAPRGSFSFARSVTTWIKDKLWIPETLKSELKTKKDIYFIEHHLSHAASSFYCSGFDKAAILTVDGVGEWATATFGVGEGTRIKIHKEMNFPHSLGLLYSAFTYYLGFKVNSGEYKVMGLAPYGEPKYVKAIYDHLVALHEDGSITLNMKYFGFIDEKTMINKEFEQVFGEPARKPETPLTQKHKDIARSIQQVTEEIVLAMANHLHKETGLTKLCMAGGVALNCVANGRIIRETPFKQLYVQPAAGDAGGALGVAAYLNHEVLKNPRNPQFMPSPYLGPAYSDEDIRSALDSYGAHYEHLSDERLFSSVANLISTQNVIGWFQGKMEWGPRALGNRSIIADCRFPKMRDTVNIKIKFRESFRPFAPVVLEEYAKEYFELEGESPYMLLVAQAKKDTMPATTHVDGSARIQTVRKDQNARLYDLIQAYYSLTGMPVIINTSFNVRGEPIVNTPKEAFECFMRTNMDYLVLGNYLLDKKLQTPWKESDEWKKNLELD